MQTALPMRTFVAIAALALVAALAPFSLAARSNSDAIPAVTLSALPAEARDVFALIHKGGPFHYDRDGIAFGNREGLLPAKPRGYYHEYTVRTPGTKSRGARRIICGGQARAPDACYYTDDHYRSFRRISE